MNDDRKKPHLTKVVKIGFKKKESVDLKKIPESDIHWDLLIEIGSVVILQFVCLVGLRSSGELSFGDGTDLVVIDLTYPFHEVLNIH
jgi:hypothetical protein